MHIAFIGAGVMGVPMMKNLMARGHTLTVFTRTREKAAPVLEMGARWAEDVKRAVHGAEAVITIVGYPRDVEALYFGPDGIIENARPGATLIDMTTSSPRLAERIHRAADGRGLFALDAPVSGGDVGAQNGTLAIMVGGERAAFDRMMPVFEAMGQNIRHLGPAGCGQHTKMANQIAIAGALAGVCEAMRYAEITGLGAEALLETISTGAAGSWQMRYNGPKIAANDFSPGFYLKHFVKDMALADEEASARGAQLSVLEAVLARSRALEADGLGEAGTQAYIKSYRD